MVAPTSRSSWSQSRNDGSESLAVGLAGLVIDCRSNAFTRDFPAVVENRIDSFLDISRNRMPEYYLLLLL